MKSLNFVILGDESIANELGKKGSVSDMTFYERKAGDRIFSFIAPSSFPEKIQPLLQSIMLSEYVIMNMTKIDKHLGEQIVALDSLGMENGFIIANGFENEIRNFAKSTVLEKYQLVTLDELKKKIEELDEVKIDGKTKIILDAAFEVKGVGTVLLGIVRRGSTKKYDELEIFPQKKSVFIRSIQMHDDDVDVANSPARVGLAVKGISSNEISRGDVLSTDSSVKVSKSVKISFEKNKFYRGEIKQSSNYHAQMGLQIIPVSIGNDSLTSQKEFAYEPGEIFLLLDLNSDSIRIVGKGKLLD